MTFFKTTALLLITLCICGCKEYKENNLTPQEAKEIAKKAYIYGLPLVMNYKTLYANTIDENSGDYKGDFNQLSCEARLYTPEDKAIVTVNSDTPYCMFWSDIREEPVIFSVYDIEPDRYYSFQFIDLYTHNFAYVGSLTTGSKAGKYMVVLDDWKGKVPEGITKVIRCETGIFFTIIRTQLLNSNDLENVKSIQDSYKLQTLSEYIGQTSVKKTKKEGFPEWIEGEQFTEASFKYLNTMLNLVTPPESEQALIQEFSKLGIGTKDGFDINNFDLDVQEAIKQGVKEAFADMEAFIKKTSTDPLGSSKIFGTRTFLEQSAKTNFGHNNLYMIRAVAAYLGIYGNSAVEAIYPTYLVDSEGQPMDASKFNYKLTFEADKLPPVKAFWSLTMYDGKTQLLIDNPLDRYLINSSMLESFVKNKDGSITIYIQKESPGKEFENNWLPAPNGPFYCVMRLYGPEQQVINGNWVSPKLIKQ